MTQVRSLDKDIGARSSTIMGFYSWNVPENRVFGDDVIADIFGVSREELMSGAPIEHVIRYVGDGDKQRLAKIMHDAILTGLVCQGSFSVIHPDGHAVSVVSNGRCMRDPEGIPSIYSGVIRIQPDDGEPPVLSEDELESHCLAALKIAKTRRNSLAARYLSSALNVISGKAGR